MPPRKRPARKPPIKPPQPKTDGTPCPPPQVTEHHVRSAGVALSLVFVAICLALVASRGCEIDLTPDPKPDPKPPVVELDPLAKSHLADRSSKIRILRDMAGKMQAGEFQSDQQQADWWNKAIDDARREDFRPFVDATAEAIVDDKVSEFADRLEVQP